MATGVFHARKIGARQVKREVTKTGEIARFSLLRQRRITPILAVHELWQKAAVMDLSGRLLVAMPGMGDPRFESAVILICAHSEDGAMGIIINKPAPELNFSGLLDHLKIPRSPQGRDIKVHFGGPVERGRGFVLHSPDYPKTDTSMAIKGGLIMTATLDILEALAQGEGPDSVLLALGYAGWGPGQLEQELTRNDWLVTDGGPELIFNADHKGKWSAALKTLGVDPLVLSATAGRA